MKKGYTLAEVLITLGIIGIVAALTIPSLVGNYKKKQYYTQFMKARSVIENALKLYANERECNDDALCGFGIIYPENDNFVLELSKYLNASIMITESNYEEICKGYQKNSANYDGTRIYNGEYECSNQLGGNSSTNGFITVDGMLLSFYPDAGDGNGVFLDINGPNSGPNTYGRDLFIFYLEKEFNKTVHCNNMWGTTRACNDNLGSNKRELLSCYDDTRGDNCAARLIEECKMNY